MCLFLVGIAAVFLISGCLQIVPIRSMAGLSRSGLSRLTMHLVANECRLVLMKMTRLRLGGAVLMAVFSVCYTVLFPLGMTGTSGYILL